MAVADMLNKVQDDFDSLKAEAEDAIGDLKTFATGAGAIFYGVDSWEGIDDLLPIKVITVTDSMIATVSALANKIGTVTYTPPPMITNFEMLDHKVWKDPLADQIEASISDYIISMGIPDKPYQDAIFNESYDRNLQVLNDLYELADAKVGARGFTYPNSMVTALKLDAQQKYQFDRNQISRDITKLVTEWARQNYQFAIEKGITFEQFHADFTYKYCTAFVEIYKSLVLASIERFKAEISKYTEPIRGLVEAAKLPLEAGKINADIQKANIDSHIESNKALIQQEVAQYATDMNNAVQQFSVRVNALDSVAKQTSAFAQASSRSVIGIQK